MLIAYTVAIELIHDLRDLVPVIKRHDADLADQIHRAATSVVLNLVALCRMRHNAIYSGTRIMPNHRGVPVGGGRARFGIIRAPRGT